jgi:hypothetical protein
MAPVFVRRSSRRVGGCRVVDEITNAKYYERTQHLIENKESYFLNPASR